MTNSEKFIEIMNVTFGAGFTKDNLFDDLCSPCGKFKRGACESYSCEGCKKWWGKEYRPLRAEDAERLGGIETGTEGEDSEAAVQL